MRIRWLVQLLLGCLVIGLGGWRVPSLAAPPPVLGVNLAQPALASEVDPYPIGNPTLTDLWVDPVNGQDSATGASRAQALATIRAAWQRIPSGAPLTTTGYRIQLVAGEYEEESIPEYWEDRHGTAQFPILLQAADGSRTVHLAADLNLYNVSYVYLLGLRIQSEGDVFHCEACDHLLIRDSALLGSRATSHENVKINQSRHIYLEDNEIVGAEQNAIDFVAVQHGHLRRNQISQADDWCIYLKGGSAHFRIEGNAIHHCGTGGFSAGEGTGFEYMVSPWLHYEAYDLKVVNNVIYETEGAGLGVNGGYNILLAYNTLYRVGARSHVLEFGLGSRSCDGDTALPGRCTANLAAGGWGTTTVGGEAEPIPNRDIVVYNNLIYNPAGYQSQWQQVAIAAPRTSGPDSNILAPAHADDHLVIRGNLIWNGPADHPLGIGDDTGCQPSNPTCSATQLLADNTINTVEPALRDPAQGDFRPAVNSNLATVTTYGLPTFPAWDNFTPPVAAGDLMNSVPLDRNGVARTEPGLPGAYADSNSQPNLTATATLFPSPTTTNRVEQTVTTTPTSTGITPVPTTSSTAYLYLPAIAQRAEQQTQPTSTATPPLPTASTTTPTPSTTANSTPVATLVATLVPTDGTTTSTVTPSSTPTPSATGTLLATATHIPSATGTTVTATATPTPASTAVTSFPAGPLTLVMLGDSVTEGQGDESMAGGGYPQRLLALVQSQRAGSTATNLGQSGWTAAGLINGVDGEPAQLATAVDQLNRNSGAKAALVWIGSNDLWYLYEYGNPSPADETQDVETFTANINTILSQLRATGATIFLALLDDQSQRPVIADPPNPGEPAFPGISVAERQRMSQQVSAYNNVLRAKAAQYGAQLVDFSNTTLFTTPDTLADDGNHPNAAGYDLITAQWFAVIEPLLGSERGTRK